MTPEFVTIKLDLSITEVPEVQNLIDIAQMAVEALADPEAAEDARQGLQTALDALRED